MSEFYPSHEFELYEDHEIFATALDAAHHLQSQVFETVEDAQAFGRNELHDLNLELYMSGLMGENVTLHGFDIAVPQVLYDPEFGYEQIVTKELDTSIGEPLESSGIDGRLFGFYPYIKRDVITNKYMIEIHNQISITNDIFLSTFAGRLCAHGNITSTNVEFQHDTRLKQYASAIESMIDTSRDDEPTALAVERLKAILDPRFETGLYDIKNVRAIGRIVRNLEGKVGKISYPFRDAVISSVESRYGIDDTSQFALSAMSGILRQFSQSDKLKMTTDIKAQELNITGASFTHYYRMKNGKMNIDSNSDALAFTTNISHSGQDGVLYIPLEKMRSLELVEDA